jgi:hypothetical protein
MPEPLNVDDIIEGFSDERNMVAVARALISSYNLSALPLS